MNHFQYRNGTLHAEDVPLDRLAEEVGTPFYCYSSATLERHYTVFSGALPNDALVAFSVKANGNLAVLKTLARLGAGADVVSGGFDHTIVMQARGQKLAAFVLQGATPAISLVLSAERAKSWHNSIPPKSSSSCRSPRKGSKRPRP